MALLRLMVKMFCIALLYWPIIWVTVAFAWLIKATGQVACW